MGNARHDVYKYDISGTDDFFLQGKYHYFFMKEGVYSSRIKAVVAPKRLTDKDKLDIWEGNWESPKQRRKVLESCCGRRFYESCSNTWNKVTFSNAKEDKKHEI